MASGQNPARPNFRIRGEMGNSGGNAVQADTDDNDCDMELNKIQSMKTLMLEDTPSPSCDVNMDSAPVVEMSHPRGHRNEEEHRAQSASQDNGSAGSAGHFKGLAYGTREKLEEYVSSLKDREQDSGIFVWNEMTPVLRKGVLCYEESKEFKTVKSLKHPSPKRLPFGVFLCQDIQTSQQFIIKKIQTTKRRLPGIEHLVRRVTEKYLPEIYGVFKEKDVLWIFQEYIENTLENISWDLGQIYVFSQSFLSALSDLHREDLVHYDIKCDNMVIRDPQEPDSLVLIDFESARHPKYDFKAKGYTLAYLSPWHKRIPSSEAFNPLMKTADLWAAACVLITLISKAVIEDRNKPHGHSIWAKSLHQLRQKCSGCRNQSCRLCKDCENNFRNFLENSGDQILHIHLEPLMKDGADDPHWRPLHELLLYLTDTTNVDHKNARSACECLGTVDAQGNVQKGD